MFWSFFCTNFYNNIKNDFNCKKNVVRTRFFHVQVIVWKRMIGLQILHQLFKSLRKKTVLRYTTCMEIKTVCFVQWQTSSWLMAVLDTQKCRYAIQLLSKTVIYRQKMSCVRAKIPCSFEFLLVLDFILQNINCF